MRKVLAFTAGMALLAALPALAETELLIQLMVRDLAPGARVDIVGMPQYLLQSGAEAEPVALSQADSVEWMTNLAPATQAADWAPEKLHFPLDIDRTVAPDHQGTIYLKARFRVDAPTGNKDAGYGETLEAIVTMPVVPGNTPLARCLRLREAAGHLVVDSAPECTDASFAEQPATPPVIRRGTPGVARVPG